MMTAAEIIEKSGGANASEHAHQSAYFCECSRLALYSSDPIWLMGFAIPNGGHRDKITAARMKSEGVKRGVPDILFPIARHGRHGLFIEMKLPGFTQSAVQPEQMFWLHALDQQGYATAISGGWEFAIEVTKQYLFAKDQSKSSIVLA